MFSIGHLLFISQQIASYYYQVKNGQTFTPTLKSAKIYLCSFKKSRKVADTTLAGILLLCTTAFVLAEDKMPGQQATKAALSINGTLWIFTFIQLAFM